jgi:hypothetical protein
MHSKLRAEIGFESFATKPGFVARQQKCGYESWKLSNKSSFSMSAYASLLWTSWYQMNTSSDATDEHGYNLLKLECMKSEAYKTRTHRM